MTRKTAVQGLDSILTRVASPVTLELPEISPIKGRKFKSRFFFVVPEEELQALRVANAPKTDTPDNAEVVAVTEKLMASLPVEIQTNAEKVRKFFLEEIAPLTLAIAVGESQVKDVLKQVTNGGTVDTSTFAKFDKMAHEAVMLRMAAFLENYLKLGDGASARLLVPASSSNNKQSAAPPNSKEEETPPGFRRLARSLEKLAAAQDRGGKNGPVAG
jgi:hypothetical protein